MYTTFRGCMDEEHTGIQQQAIKKGVDLTVCSVFLVRN